MEELFYFTLYLVEDFPEKENLELGHSLREFYEGACEECHLDADAFVQLVQEVRSLNQDHVYVSHVA